MQQPTQLPFQAAMQQQNAAIIQQQRVQAQLQQQQQYQAVRATCMSDCMVEEVRARGLHRLQPRTLLMRDSRCSVHLCLNACFCVCVAQQLEALMAQHHTPALVMGRRLPGAKKSHKKQTAVPKPAAPAGEPYPPCLIAGQSVRHGAATRAWTMPSHGAELCEGTHLALQEPYCAL